MFNLSQGSGHLEVKFYFEGEIYDVERFNISFLQPADYKHQPQHEVRGGQIFLSLTQILDSAVYNWGKRSTLKKSGKISIETQVGSNPLDIEFENAYCVSFARTTNFVSGTRTELIISPETVKLNGKLHKNRWGE